MSFSSSNTTPTNTPTMTFQINGLIGAPLQNVQTLLEGKAKTLQQTPTPAAFQRFYNAIPHNVELALEPYGYFQPIIHTQLNHQALQWLVTINVTPGNQVYFRHVTIDLEGEGRQDPAFQKILKNFPVKIDTPFNAAQYDEGKELLTNTATNKGYFQAKIVTNQLIIDVPNQSATAVIKMETGKRHLFGESVFTKTPFKESFLKRFLFYAKGEPYTSYAVKKTRLGLEGSNYFERVVALPDFSHPNNLYTPITYQVPMQKQSVYTVGAGYGTDTGVRALLGADYRWINDRGHSINALILAAPRNSEALVNYVIPGRHPSLEQWTFTGGVAKQNQVSGVGDSARLITNYSAYVSQWRFSLSLIGQYEEYQLRHVPWQDTYLFYPSLVIQRSHADQRLRPRYGYNTSFNLIGAEKDILSKTSFSQARWNFRTILSPFDLLRFYFQTNLGVTDVADINSIPLSLQLYAGGPESIRGFKYNGIGPGRYLAVGTAEAQVRVYGEFYLSGFIDAGNVSNDLIHEKLNIGVGPGIVWSSPIGIIEFDVACAVSNAGNPWMVALTVGPEI